MSMKGMGMDGLRKMGELVMFGLNVIIIIRSGSHYRGDASTVILIQEPTHHPGK